MTFGRGIQLVGAAVLLSACAVPVAQQKSQLDATLAQLDQSASKFTSAQAKFHKELYTAVVHDTDQQDGITYASRKGGASEVGIKIEGNGARTVVYKNGTAKDYNPGLNCYNTYSAANSKGTIESLLTLAFGASGKELKAAWTITDVGPEALTVDGKSMKVEKLDLVPKDQALKNNVKHIELWTDLATAVSPKQIVYSPSGDTRTATYSNVRLNQTVDTKPFEIKGKPCGK